MPNVRTAISIEKPIFDQMDALSKKMNLSRSRVFSLAAREFIKRSENAEILDALSAAYDDPLKPDDGVERMRPRHHAVVKDQW
jgi:metal-responsive CopG/Arc/MetJ family transcriptional regulator